MFSPNSPNQKPIHIPTADSSFSKFAAGLFFNRMIDVIESKGARTTLTGMPRNKENSVKVS
jgi:hypothetical protein